MNAWTLSHACTTIQQKGNKLGCQLFGGIPGWWTPPESQWCCLHLVRWVNDRAASPALARAMPMFRPCCFGMQPFFCKLVVCLNKELVWKRCLLGYWAESLKCSSYAAQWQYLLERMLACCIYVGKLKCVQLQTLFQKSWNTMDCLHAPFGIQIMLKKSSKNEVEIKKHGCNGR